MAVVVAGVILITTVLPAEYGIDPVGTGRALGLTAIASPPLNPVEMARTEGAALKPTPNGPLGEYPGSAGSTSTKSCFSPTSTSSTSTSWRKAATMAFSWTASAPILQDFHGERAAGGTEGAPAEESFDKRDRNAADGSFIAPFAGIQGWYWENCVFRPW